MVFHGKPAERRDIRLLTEHIDLCALLIPMPKVNIRTSLGTYDSL